MTERVYNFSAGPAVLPVEVLEEARENLISLGKTGVGILEHSHRGKAFLAVYEETVHLCRELAGIPDDYDVLFLQGGASTQFFQIPMNFLTADRTADYLITGSWSKKAIAEAERFGKTHVVCSSQDRNFCYIPQKRDDSPSPTYVHFTSNNTIYGTEFRTEPEVPAGGVFGLRCQQRYFLAAVGHQKIRHDLCGGTEKPGAERRHLGHHSQGSGGRRPRPNCPRCCNTARTPRPNRCTTRRPHLAFTSWAWCSNG